MLQSSPGWLNPASVEQFVIFMGLGVMALLWFDTKGHYRQRLPYWEVFGQIMTMVCVGFICSGFIYFATRDESSRLWFGLRWPLFGLFVIIGRELVSRWLAKQGLWQINAVVVGKGPTAQMALTTLRREQKMGYAVTTQVAPEHLKDLVKTNAWKHLLMLHEASHVFIALEGGDMEQHQAAIKAMVRSRIPYSIVPPWHGLPSSTLSPHHFMMHDVLILHNTNRLRLPLPRLLKRCFDMLAASAAILALTPVFLVVAVMVRRDGGPALFSQPRVGQNGKLFNCYKFRSMRIDAEQVLEQYLAQSPEAAKEWQQFQKLKNDVRITAFGQFIRKTSIDELPQLLNVIKGEMSLVGPRPIMPGQEEFYAEDFSYYESVRPGITGPWQVSGRNKLTFKERVALESCYARNWTPWMDIVIILKTIPALLTKDQAF
jgi:undecaprenyl-phosphate galactose phosphotransferase